MCNVNGKLLKQKRCAPGISRTHSSLDNLTQRTPSGFHNRLEILQRLFRLGFYPTFHQLHCVRIESETTRDEEEVSCFHSLAVRSDCGGCIYVKSNKMGITV